jgi:hypothetical protein
MGSSSLRLNSQQEKEPDESKKVTPQFARPSFRGHDFTTKGTLHVALQTGFVVVGKSESEASSERTVMIINKNTNKRKTVKAKVDIVATTTYVGDAF